ncbi:MAG: UDP-N-acetylglucosamine 2-epimerase (non-hydrolyzing), partial [Pricia sp.]|nr:UDP-N-acetylglucosamine 2-epimerase (non-hydrolyzing) [Pricia sp.]
MKIVTILGARPQFIKASSLSREIGKRPDCEEIIVHTGQHFDENMSAIFFDEMEIPKPKYNLDINSLSHGAMTGRMLEEIEKILLIEKPDWTIVYGDTNSTIAGALAAKKLHTKVAHIEAGLRSFDMRMPEEINRILTDQISDILFCPTLTAVENLKKEGFEQKKIRVSMSGDIMFDSALYYKHKMKRPKGVDNDEPSILVTIHRQENTDDPKRLRNILNALNTLAEEGNNLIWPIHPRTSKII